MAGLLAGDSGRDLLCIGITPVLLGGACNPRRTRQATLPGWALRINHFPQNFTLRSDVSGQDRGCCSQVVAFEPTSGPRADSRSAGFTLTPGGSSLASLLISALTEEVAKPFNHRFFILQGAFPENGNFPSEC